VRIRGIGRTRPLLVREKSRRGPITEKRAFMGRLTEKKQYHYKFYLIHPEQSERGGKRPGRSCHDSIQRKNGAQGGMNSMKIRGASIQKKRKKRGVLDKRIA